jgi:S1-C subfamily serine protease
MTRLRPRRLRIGRAGLAIAIAALLVVGGAYAITSVQDSGSPPASVSQTAWLGVQLLASPKGAEVAGVTPGSPAQLAGLRPGDVITQIEGQPVVVPVNVVYVVQALTHGRTVQLQYVRGRETHSTDVKLAARPARVSSP